METIEDFEYLISNLNINEKIDLKYSNGKIYGAWYEDKWIYIGATTQELRDRIWQHLNARKKEKYMNRNFYKFLNELTEEELSKVEFKLIEEYSCNNKYELFNREGHHQRLYKDTILNQQISNRKEKEYRKTREYKDKKKIWDKKYREGEHRKDLLQRKRDYHHTHKEEISIKNKEYREGPKREELLNGKKEWYEKNKERINIIFDCPCGGTYMIKSKNRHLLTKKHQNYINNKK